MAENPTPLFLQYTKLCEEINRDYFQSSERGFENICVQLYHQYDRVEDRKMRFRIVNTATNVVLCDHLNPERADSHTYHLIVCAVNDAYKAGIEQGRIIAVKSMINSMCEATGVKRESVIKTVVS